VTLRKKCVADIAFDLQGIAVHKDNRDKKDKYDK
jgi:hypothetical protein